LQGAGLPAEQKSNLRELLQGVRGLNAAGQGPAQESPRQGLTVPFQVRSGAVTSGVGVRYNGYAHSFGGMGIQFILFMGIDVGVAMLLQRQRGVWKRLRAAPLSRGSAG
jgi:ABC-2 type transport system permease protein